ncbi:Uncharacterised protein [Segatella copri]|nr:Uncharacterised protein [Segatella copri]
MAGRTVVATSEGALELFLQALLTQIIAENIQSSICFLQNCFVFFHVKPNFYRFICDLRRFVCFCEEFIACLGKSSPERCFYAF